MQPGRFQNHTMTKGGAQRRPHGIRRYLEIAVRSRKPPGAMSCFKTLRSKASDRRDGAVTDLWSLLDFNGAIVCDIASTRTRGRVLPTLS